ncbi:MAG: porin family protein [Alphaproteobacteria bacterium]|nr:porin family protein [Alphaproteobacteria bacterium]
MKKIAFLASILVASPAIANDFYYAEYASPDAEYTAPNASSSAPIARDNYIGLRLHKNERISYAFDVRNGAGTTLKNDNVGFGAFVGNRLTDFLKIEFETIYTGLDDAKRDLDLNFDIWANMVNVYMFKTYGGAVEPYAGIGLGFSTIWSDISGWGFDANNTTFDFSYSLMAGVSFALNDRVDLNLGFKYIKYGDADHKTSAGTFATTDIDATEFYLGAAYKFGLK